MASLCAASLGASAFLHCLAHRVHVILVDRPESHGHSAQHRARPLNRDDCVIKWGQRDYSRFYVFLPFAQLCCGRIRAGNRRPLSDQTAAPGKACCSALQTDWLLKKAGVATRPLQIRIRARRFIGKIPGQKCLSNRQAQHSSRGRTHRRVQEQRCTPGLRQPQSPATECVQ